MRLAYGLAVHKNEEQVQRLIEALQNERDVILVHVDQKASPSFRAAIARTVARYRTVRMLRSRNVVWGGWSQCEVTLASIRELLEWQADWSHFINLSGQDYPIKTRSAIVRELEGNPDANYIDIQSLSTTSREVRRRTRWLCVESARRIYQLPIPVFSPRGLKIAWKGSNWHVLSRAFCEWITSEPLAARCIAHIRHLKNPDELLMQCLIMNSPFVATLVPNDRRETIWNQGARNPELLTMGHLRMLEASTAWFARKFDDAVDGDILPHLARRLQHDAASSD